MCIRDRYFSQCFNLPIPPLTETLLNGHENQCPESLLCDQDTVLELLTLLDVSKSSGPDGISAKMLKNTAGSICPSITHLFNQSMASGQIPDQWKQSHIVPIPKSTKIQSPDNYRPISLLSVLGKLLEKHVHSLIISHLTERDILSDSQWGFLPVSYTHLTLPTIYSV